MRKLAYAWMIAASLSHQFRRNMASYATGTTRYAVRLLAPAEGPVLGVATRNAKASAVSAYEVLQEPAGAPFDGLQVHVARAPRVGCVAGDSLGATAVVRAK